MRTLAGVVILTSAFLSNTSAMTAERQPQRTVLQDHVAWVADSLQRMQTVKPGMPRADLLKLFDEDGGIQTDRVFVFRDCPYFKVSVEWEPTGRAPARISLTDQRALIEAQLGDVIKTISRPYLEFAKID